MATPEFTEVATKNLDRWVPACGGDEKPFTSRSGIRMLYCWNPRKGHAYLNVDTDMVMTSQEAEAAMQILTCPVKHS